MSTAFDVIADEFSDQLAAISELVDALHGPGANPRARIASINSATLLLAATFEEFIREMGREFARQLVASVDDPQKLPRKLTATAWKRTLEQLAREKIDTGGTPLSIEHISSEARARFDAVWEFLSGDLTKDIYQPLIHNDNNMRPGEINAIFSVCDLSEVCRKISEEKELKDYFDEEEAGKVCGQLMTLLNDFMEDRNSIAHSLGSTSSRGVEDFKNSTMFLKAFSKALARCLPKNLPTAAAAA